MQAHEGAGLQPRAMRFMSFNDSLLQHSNTPCLQIEEEQEDEQEEDHLWGA